MTESTGTAVVYRRFASMEARGYSPSYERLTAEIAQDADLIALLDELPMSKRQPNLLLAAVRFLGGPLDDHLSFRAWLTAHWPRVRSTMLDRMTQTNEPARCATLLPLLAALPQPLALIEVGASAGLCLYPDRYRYVYDDRPAIGPQSSPVTFTCETTGPVPLPLRPPTVAWRAGIDLNPLDATDPGDVGWLESLVWPEQTERLRRLRAALGIARAEPAHLVRGDLTSAIAVVAAQAPADATLVVFHSAVLSYLSPAARDSFTATVRSLPGHWISNEADGVLPSVRRRLPHPPPEDRAVFVLALDEHPVAFTGPHGQSLEWFSSIGSR